jgi:hypothetical protein
VAVNCRSPGESRFLRLLATARCPWFPLRSGTRLARPPRTLAQRTTRRAGVDEGERSLTAGNGALLRNKTPSWPAADTPLYSLTASRASHTISVMPRTPSAVVSRILPVFTLTLVLAACGSGSAPARRAAPPRPSPTTARQLSALLVTTADLPDRIQGSRDPINLYVPSPSASPAPAQPSCSDLEVQSLFLGSTPSPVNEAGGNLYLAVGQVTRQTGFPWEAWDSVAVYRPGQAGQIMAELARTAARCASVISKATDGAGPAESTRTHLVTLHGMGDEAFDVQARHTLAAPRTVTVASDWILIRSGDYLLMVGEMGNPVSWNKYLLESAKAAWLKFRKGA